MRFSKLISRTNRQILANEDTVISHKLLVQAGFIQAGVGAGLYNYLTLGKIVLDKIQNIVKEELNRVGCQEVSLSFVTAEALWKESGRASEYGDELLRFTDRKDNKFVLSATNEEAMVNLVRQSIKSYKQLSINLYQVNLKYRDELRAKFGLMRSKEFLMKDGYSFHTSVEDMVEEFELMEKTYSRIFTRLGLDFRIVDADSGQIGGLKSKEFMVLADSGEDDLIVCDSCGYGANTEVHTDFTEGDKCSCGSELRITKGIEVGHIFQLGNKYSESMNATYLNKDGKKAFFEMGTYGIGVSRLMGAIIEQNHDDKGCVWTKETQAFDYHIIISNIKNEEQYNEAFKLYEFLINNGKSVIIDDRKDRFGAKINDYELMGMATGIIVGNKVSDNLIEVIDRKKLEKVEMSINFFIDKF